MTPSGEVLAKEEALVDVRELDLFVTVMFLDLVYPRVPLPHQLLLHLHRNKLWQTRKFQQQEEVKGRTRTHQHEETRGVNQQKTKIQIKKTTRNYIVVSCKVCWIGYRSSRMDWLMKVYQNIDMLPVLLMNLPLEQRAKVVPRKHNISTHFLCESRHNHWYAVVVQDLAIQWIQSYPCKTKTSHEKQKRLQKFLEPPTRKPKVIYTDNSLEFGKACEELTWNHCASTPHRSETHGIAERAVRRVKEGTSAVLLQSGLGNEWADSMECYWYLRNIQDLLSDVKTPYERRFGIPWNGPVIPFGAMVAFTVFLPRTCRDCINSVQKSCQVLFSVLHYSAGSVWKRDILVEDIEELEQIDAPEIYATRLNAKEVLTPMGGDQILTTSTLIRELSRPRRRTRQFFKKNQTELPLHAETHRCMMVKLEMISGPFQAIFFTVITWNPEPNCTCPVKNHSPMPLKYIDVMSEKHIDDYWNVDEDRELSDAWTGFTRYILLNEKPPDGYTWSEERLTRKQTTSRPDNLWPDMWKHVSDASKRKEKHKWTIEEPELDNARRLRGIFFIEPDDEELKRILKNARMKLEIPMPAAMLCRLQLHQHRETCELDNARRNMFILLRQANLWGYAWMIQVHTQYLLNNDHQLHKWRQQR